VISVVDSFTAPVTRLIPMPQNVKTMPKYWGALRYNDTSRQFEFVPHTANTVNGRLYVVIKSKTNSVYVVVENPVTFSDVRAGEWYTEYIAKAGSKKLVNGVGNGLYEPERAVTRAEFVQMMANALQLTKASSATGAYNDVTGDWYYDAVMRVKSAGLLAKFTGDRFNPNQPITREEMAVILAAAIRHESPASASKAVNVSGLFNDYGRFNADYISDIELVYGVGIMNGVGNKLFDPKGTTTRAQAATVQIRLLETLRFID